MAMLVFRSELNSETVKNETLATRAVDRFAGAWKVSHGLLHDPFSSSARDNLPFCFLLSIAPMTNSDV